MSRRTSSSRAPRKIASDTTLPATHPCRPQMTVSSVIDESVTTAITTVVMAIRCTSFLPW
jgi:hypothetical protein